MPRYFIPGDQRSDRGRVLEGARETFTNQVLSRTFADLRPGERDGWRPSLLVTPTIVEQGRRLIIGNLDLGGAESGTLTHGVQLFRLFPAASADFKLSTALRMNAAFPFVSPAVPLPISQPRLLVVDAGSPENFGVALVDARLARHVDWIVNNTSGVALVEIRAYPLGLEEELKGPRPDEQSNRGLRRRSDRWLEDITAPFESHSVAKSASMIHANNSTAR